MGQLLQHIAVVSQQQLEVQRNLQEQLQCITHARTLQELVPQQSNLGDAEPCCPSCSGGTRQWFRSCAANTRAGRRQCGAWAKVRFSCEGLKGLSALLPLLVALAGLALLVFVLHMILARFSS